MSFNLKRELERLSDRLRQFLYTKNEVDFHHGTVYVPSDDSIQLGETVPGFDLCSRTQLHDFRVPWHFGGHHNNYLLGERSDHICHDVVRDFQSLLPSMRELIDAMPKHILPTVKIPALQNRNDDNLSVWLTIVRWITASEFGGIGKPWFYFNLNYADYSLDGQLQHWDNLTVLSGLNPLELFIPFEKSVRSRTVGKPIGSTRDQRHGKAVRSWSYWRTQYEKSGLRFPEVIACVGCKPAIRTSLETAQTLVLLIRNELQPVLLARRRRARSNSKLDPKVRDLFEQLWQYHKDSKTPRTPLTQIELAERMRLSQSTVSRAFGLLFANVSDPRGAYHDLCSENSIQTFLQKYEAKAEGKDHRERNSDMGLVADTASYKSTSTLQRSASHEEEVDDADEERVWKSKGERPK